MTERLANWAGNVVFGAERFHRPAAIGELRRLVGQSKRIRALGTGHSFSPIADTAGDLVSLADLPKIMEIDAGRASVRVSAAVRYGELARYLDNAGYALHNLGSLPHISVAGACATGTHGSGDAKGNLATAVRELEMITTDGDFVTISRERDGDQFRGAVVALGALGIVTSLSLDIEPAFAVRQYVYEDLPAGELDEHLDQILASGYSVSLFTTWRSSRIDQVWIKQRVTADGQAAPAPAWHGARLADGPRHPVPGMPAANCTPQLGVAGPWHERLPHFRLDFTPSSGQELQSEYLLPRIHAVQALRAIADVSDRIAPVVQISEVRTVAADDLWLSPSYQRDTVAIHFTWIADSGAVAPVLALVEAQLAPFQPRPHWGKIFGISPERVAGVYPRLPDFRRLRRSYDATGKFGNRMLSDYLTDA